MARSSVLLTLSVIVVLSGCASSEPPPRGPGPMTSGSTYAGVELTLPANWWRDSSIAAPLALTGEQLQRLDALVEPQEEVARLERDGMMAGRELRDALEAKNASATAIISAGNHLRAMRDALLERQIALIAAQREILTREQWNALQLQIVARRRPPRGEGGPRVGPGGGAGGRGGRGGRRPGGAF